MQLVNLEKMFYLNVTDKHSFLGHSHFKGYEANIMLSGHLEITCGETNIYMRAGELVIYDATMFHRNRVASGRQAEFISLHLDIKGDLGRNFLGFYKLSPDNQALGGILRSEVNKDSADVSHSARCIVEALLLRAEQDEHKPYISYDAASLVYKDAVDYMNKNINKKLSLADISHNCGVCVTTLKNAFTQFADKGVMEYFFGLRMEYARNLLMNNVSSKQICNMMGFSSPSYFSQCFKREYGCNAREYLNKRLKLVKNFGQIKE